MRADGMGERKITFCDDVASLEGSFWFGLSIAMAILHNLMNKIWSCDEFCLFSVRGGLRLTVMEIYSVVPESKGFSLYVNIQHNNHTPKYQQVSVFFPLSPDIC